MKNVLFCAYGDPPHKWELINDTPEDRLKAIQNGAKNFTAYAFSEAPHQNSNTMRFGDLTVDFD